MMQWLDHAGRPLAYIVQGQGPLVILVHGLGASMSDWRFQVAPLAERLQVATVDLPGFGDSPPPALRQCPHRRRKTRAGNYSPRTRRSDRLA